MSTIDGNNSSFKIPNGPAKPQKDIPTPEQKKMKQVVPKALSSLSNNIQNKSIKAKIDSKADQKPGKVANDRLKPSNDIMDIPEPTKKAPVRAITQHKAALDDARDEFVKAQKKGSVSLGQFEKFATSISFQERRARSSLPSSDLPQFQKHLDETRQILFSELGGQVQKILGNTKDFDATMRATKAVLSGTNMMINASGLPKEKQAAVTAKLEGSIRDNLVAQIKKGLPTSQEGISNEYRAKFSQMFKDINALPISDDAKQEIREQVSREFRARFPKKA